jgi:serine protease Do
MKNRWQIGAVLMAVVLMAAMLLAAAPVSFAQTKLPQTQPSVIETPPPAPPAPPAPQRVHAAAIAVRSAPYLGVSVMDVDGGRAKTLKLKEERGAEITQTDPSGPAAKAGVKVGDVVLEFNGQPVQDSEQLQRLVRETVPGREAKLSVWRNGASQAITATIESRRMAMIGGEPWFTVAVPPMPAMPAIPPMPPMPSFDFEIPHIQAIMQNAVLGIAGEPLGDEQQFAEFFGVKDGVLVKEVDSNSAAERAGIKAGDVIVKVGETRVGSLRELTTALRTARSKGSYTLTVVRNKKEMPVTVISGG